jgi:predicted PurR-regulated permease PerM
MIGSVIELILIFFIFILGLLFAIIFNIIITTFNYINEHDNDLDQVVKDPLRSISKLPKKIKSSFSDASKIVKGTTSKFNNLVTKKNRK